MTPHHYRILTPLEDRPIIDYPETDTSNSKFEERENPTTTAAANYTSCCYNSLKLTPPFDSAMALTVLVLLTALFFMGFFSIYIRRFADESSVDPTRRRSNQSSPEYSSSTAAVEKKGVDPTTVNSMPVHAYSGGGEKQGIEVECAICLSEFEDGEWVKVIPYCRHVFHVECIDTWLSSHVTCPLCRTGKFFPAVAVEKEVVVHVAVGEEEEEEEEGRGLDVSEAQGEVESGGEREVRLAVDERATWNGAEREVRLVVDERPTWNREDREVGPRGERRSTSSSWLGERITLHRSLSF